ncbi:MAG: hypothetical protein AB7V46_24605 [Thermomicrobiales bacterium]
MVEAAETKTIDEIAAFAADLANRAEWKHILRLLKNDVITKWANEQDAEVRDDLWYRVQAIGQLEQKVLKLKDDHALNTRKAEAAKRKP